MRVDGRSGEFGQGLRDRESDSASVSRVGRCDRDGDVTVLVEVDTGGLVDTVSCFTEEILLSSRVGGSDDVLSILPVTVSIVSSPTAKGSCCTPSTASSSAVCAGSRSWRVPACSVAARSRVAVGGGGYRRAISTVGSAIESWSSVSVDSISCWLCFGDEFRSGCFEAVFVEKEQKKF